MQYYHLDSLQSIKTWDSVSPCVSYPSYISVADPRRCMRAAMLNHLWLSTQKASQGFVLSPGSPAVNKINMELRKLQLPKKFVYIHHLCTVSTNVFFIVIFLYCTKVRVLG